MTVHFALAVSGEGRARTAQDARYGRLQSGDYLTGSYPSRREGRIAGIRLDVPSADPEPAPSEPSDGSKRRRTALARTRSPHERVDVRASVVFLATRPINMSKTGN